MLFRNKKKRKLSLIITVVDFIIIFIVIFYINHRVFKVKRMNYNNFSFKYKYDKLKNDIGYIFSLTLENTGKSNYIVKVDNNVGFFIKHKESGKLIWAKPVKEPSDPINLSGMTNISLQPDEVVSYTYIYNFQHEVRLTNAIWHFGTRFDFGTNNFVIDIKRSTIPKEGWGNLIE